MENGDIPDEGITASSFVLFAPASEARLEGSGKWATLGSEVNPWIQADIQYQTHVSGVLTQGDGDALELLRWG